MHSIGNLILNSVLLGFALAMDAFSVSIVNGLNEPHMPRKRICLIAGVFGGFQFLMPMIGWVCVTTIISAFRVVQPYIPWIAMILLIIIGGKMVYEGFRGKSSSEKKEEILVSKGALFVQGLATSIDALSVGFTMTELNWPHALGESLLIGSVTFVICTAGLVLGKRIGARLADRSTVIGGLILVFIGVRMIL